MTDNKHDNLWDDEREHGPGLDPTRPLTEQTDRFVLALLRSATGPSKFWVRP